MNIIRNAFTENLVEGEFVAINPAGVPIGRASSRDALEHAHAADSGVQILSAAEVADAQPTIAEAATAKLDGPFAAIVAQGIGANEDEVLAAEGERPTAEEQVAKMDPDGDGKIGGAPKGGNKKKAAASK